MISFLFTLIISLFTAPAQESEPYFFVITNQVTEDGSLPLLDLSLGGSLYVIGGNITTGNFAYVECRQFIGPDTPDIWIPLWKLSQIDTEIFCYERLFSLPFYTTRSVGHVVSGLDGWLSWYNILREPDFFGHESSIAHSDITKYWPHPYMDPNNVHFAYRHPFPSLTETTSNTFIIEFRLVDGDFITPNHKFMLVYY